MAAEYKIKKIIKTNKDITVVAQLYETIITQISVTELTFTSNLLGKIGDKINKAIRVKSGNLIMLKFLPDTDMKEINIQLYAMAEKINKTVLNEKPISLQIL